MESLLEHYGLSKLGPHLREEGIETPDDFVHLEQEDITGFIEGLKGNGVKVTLGEKSKLRKAWKEVEDNQWICIKLAVR